MTGQPHKLDELLQILESDLLRCELVLEAVLDRIQAGVAIQPLQDRKLFVVEAEVIQPDRLLDDPVLLAMVALAARRQVGTDPQPYHP